MCLSRWMSWRTILTLIRVNLTLKYWIKCWVMALVWPTRMESFLSWSLHFHYLKSDWKSFEQLHGQKRVRRWTRALTVQRLTCLSKVQGGVDANMRKESMRLKMESRFYHGDSRLQNNSLVHSLKQTKQKRIHRWAQQRKDVCKHVALVDFPSLWREPLKMAAMPQPDSCSSSWIRAERRRADRSLSDMLCCCTETQP